MFAEGVVSFLGLAIVVLLGGFYILWLGKEDKKATSEKNLEALLDKLYCDGCGRPLEASIHSGEIFIKPCSWCEAVWQEKLEREEQEHDKHHEQFDRYGRRCY